MRSEPVTVKAIKAQVWSRVVGFYRPVEDFNRGKKQEFKDRHAYSINEIQSASLGDPK